MDGAPETPARTRLALGVLGLVAAAVLAVLAASVRAYVDTRCWQYLAIAGTGLLFTPVLGSAYVAIRRGRISPAIERIYGVAAAAMLLSPLWLVQVEALFAALFIIFVLATAPRLLSLERSDRWVYLAVGGGILTSAAELLPLPTRLPAALQYELPFALVVLGAAAAFTVLLVRDASRFSVRTKLVLAFLVIALFPIGLISYDTTLKVVAGEQARARDELRDGAAATAFLWSAWYDHQRYRLARVAASHSIAQACSDPAAAREAARRLDSLLPEFRGLALWSARGELLLVIGEPPGRPTAPHAELSRGGDGGFVMTHTACDGGLVALALHRDALDTWARAAAARHHATVVVRDAAGERLAGPEDAALLASLDALKDLSPRTFSLSDAILEDHEAAPPRLLELPATGQIAAATVIEPSGWVLALARDPSALHDALARQKREVHVFTLIAAILAALAALLLGHAIAAPLQRLAAALTRFTSGETSVRAEVRSQDEIGLLANQFNQMAAQVGGLLNSLEQQALRLQGEVSVRAAQEERLQLLNTELGAARDQALAANRAKSTFLAHMSHELRTPLNAIIGYGELIEEICDERKFTDIADDTRNIVRSAQHLLTLINDILDLSKIEAGKLDMVVEDFDVAALAREVAETVAPMIADNHNTLAVRIDAADTRMRSDRTKLRQALLNLLSNAAKFTERGTIVLSLRHETVAGLPCHIFTVVDQGVGIPESAQATLFDPFTQVVYPQVRKRSGTGLGLAITRRLCWLMGGEIDVESVAGKGSTFTLWIPSTFRSLAGGESWRPLRGKRGQRDAPQGAPLRASGPVPRFKS
jgi:signal transduction histidine kinase